MSYVWNRGGQPLIGPPPVVPPNTNRIPRGIIAPSGQIDLNHYSASRIRNLQALYAGGGGGATPLRSAFYLSNGYEMESPDDQDKIDYDNGTYGGFSGTGYLSHGETNDLSVAANPSNLPTINLASVLRTGPVTHNSMTMFRQVVYDGDPFRHQGNRSEISPQQIASVNVAYATAFTVELDSDWTWANSAQSSSDRQSIWQIHQTNDPSPNVQINTCGLEWSGSGSNGAAGVPGGVGAELRLWVLQCAGYSGSGSYTGTGARVDRYQFAASPGVIQRYAMIFRMGVTSGQSPQLDVYTRVGTGSWTQLHDYGAGGVWGDPIDYTSGVPCEIKTGTYKYGADYGLNAKRGLTSSPMFFQPVSDFASQAAALIAAKAAADLYN